MIIKEYDRIKALEYCKQYALSRNPAYYNFDLIGGDCTNFVSQCIYAGSSVMNFTKDVGWYYVSSYDRTASWTGVQFLYKFLTTNKGVSLFAKEVEKSNIDIADVIQLGSNDVFYHSLFVSDILGGNIYVSTHTKDAFNRPLNSYFYNQIRFLHIEGVRI